MKFWIQIKEKNVFDYELFLPLNISDFSFFMGIPQSLTPPTPRKRSPFLLQKAPLKIEILLSSYYLKIGLEVQPSSGEKDIHTVKLSSIFKKIAKQILNL